MRKKVSNDDVAKVIGDMADKIRDEMDLDLRVAKSQMNLAEKDVICTLSEKQLEVYNTYKEKREEYFKIAAQHYERKY